MSRPEMTIADETVNAVVEDLFAYFRNKDTPKPLAAIAMTIILHQLSLEGVVVEQHIVHMNDKEIH